MADLLALMPEPDRYVLDEEARPLPMFHLSTLLQFGERVALAAVEAERERLIEIVMNERVDAEATQSDHDESWNLALCHAVDAIRASSKAEGA